MCRHGDTVDLEVTIPANLSHTGHDRQAVKPIDRCIAPIIQALNTAGITTITSCCGHGTGPGVIALADGRELIVACRVDTSIDPYDDTMALAGVPEGYQMGYMAGRAIADEVPR